jgi:hypothetical protein
MFINPIIKERFMNKKIISIILLVLGMGFTACNNDETESSTREYTGTQSPGDVWEWTITTSGGAGTFTATNRTLGYDYSGDVETLSNKFIKLTVTASTEPGFTSPAEAYALEIPGTVLFIKPAGSPEVIVGAARGECPTTDTTYNWVELLEYPYDSTADTVYGTADSTVTGTNFDFSITKYLISGTLDGSDSSTGFTCTDGEMTHGSSSSVISITPSGVVIIDNGPGAGGVVGIEAPSSSVDMSLVTGAGREYRGLLFKDEATGGETETIWTRPDGSGGLTGGGYDDFEAGTETTDNAVITFGAQSTPGIINGTLTDSSGDNDILFIINLIDGRYFIYGAGHNTNDPDEPYNFFVIEVL